MKSKDWATMGLQNSGSVTINGGCSNYAVVKGVGLFPDCQ